MVKTNRHEDGTLCPENTVRYERRDFVVGHERAIANVCCPAFE
jgi:hypothetical protein